MMGYRGGIGMSARIELGFIGVGNMAGALIKGLLSSGVYERETLIVFDRSASVLKARTDTYAIRPGGSNREVVRESPVVVLSVKPQNMKEVLEEISSEVRDGHFFISIAAGIPLRLIRDILDRDIPMVRVMPNTPALLHGMSALAPNEMAGPGHVALASKIFDAVGQTVVVAESMMDAVTALSGSGPGYLFRIMECLVEAGVGVGLEREIAKRLVVQTFVGAAQLAKESKEPLSRLREMVTSPGGTTEAGLSVLKGMGLEDTICKAIRAAYERSLELGSRS
jgi:pyrroline-5-carboxylate reductase